MPDNNSTRHTSSVDLVLIDVINHFEFPDGDKILKSALPMIIGECFPQLLQGPLRAGLSFAPSLSVASPSDEPRC